MPNSSTLTTQSSDRFFASLIVQETASNARVAQSYLIHVNNAGLNIHSSHVCPQDSSMEGPAKEANIHIASINTAGGVQHLYSALANITIQADIRVDCTEINHPLNSNRSDIEHAVIQATKNLFYDMVTMAFSSLSGAPQSSASAMKTLHPYAGATNLLTNPRDSDEINTNLKEEISSVEEASGTLGSAPESSENPNLSPQELDQMDSFEIFSDIRECDDIGADLKKLYALAQGPLETLDSAAPRQAAFDLHSEIPDLH